MTDHSNDTPQVNLVAIDIAKQWNVVLVRIAPGANAVSRWRIQQRITNN